MPLDLLLALLAGAVFAATVIAVSLDSGDRTPLDEARFEQSIEAQLRLRRGTGHVPVYRIQGHDVDDVAEATYGRLYEPLLERVREAAREVK
jgi:hypothetical protein